jgi:UDP-hydrolysing UDP-N-acetyl-D-glucosamine 2-epimerase
MKKRIIAVFTGNRAEYGLQYPVINAINEHPELEYRLIVSGAHLDPHFGKTLQEITDDGFEIHDQVTIEMPEDTLYATAQAIGTGILSMSRVLDALRPDLLVVYADRFESFAAIIAGTQMNVPTAHIEGGDITEGGALDDSVRHAMSKLAHLHFTTNQQASNRVLAMGEEAWRVHTVGFPAIDLISKGKLATEAEIVDRLGLDLDRPVVVFTQHSVTTEFDQAVEQVQPSIAAIEKMARDGIQVLVTYPNNDAGGRRIIDALHAAFGSPRSNIQLHRSLGRYMYHGLIGLARNPNRRVACVGNSSSGIKETPALMCPTVNIGSRQQGRLRAENVLDAPYDENAILAATKKCLFDDAFRAICRQSSNPYGIGDAGAKIANILASVKLDANLLRKGMTLAGESRDGWFR